MDSRQLRYFTAIYEHRTLTRASEHLRVAVSALSHHLANLESALDTQLFIRQPRGMEPTAAGERLYAHAKPILKAMAIADRDVREARRQVSGDVSVGMAYSVVKAIGVDLLRRVLTDHPQLKLMLSESLSGSTMIHLLSSEVELAIVYNPPADPRLKVSPVIEERMVCVGRRDVIGSSDAPITFAEMLDLPIIILRQGLSARALLDNAALLKRLEASAQLQMNSVYAITGALLAGLGCIIGTHHFMSEHIERGDLHTRPVIEPELTRTLYICQMAEQRTSFALETVRAMILELVLAAVASGRWEATPLVGMPIASRSAL